ncbi:unnamed protein product [Dovyalis caffra]|uniref:Uncharacterized protein n=1 Tax=Dovyalis caffra TaxID=77055 RepID=A0AAV1RF34_9ROSI|nr:unnamed protein product [Dovyalis caffra]
MTRTRLSRTLAFEPGEEAKQTTAIRRGGTAMRVMVPLQGIVQGRGGLFLGSVIPCALSYFLQLYLRRKHRDDMTDQDDPNRDPNVPSPSGSAGQLTELSGFLRNSSSNLLSPRSPRGPVFLSSRVSGMVKSGDSPYYAGLKKVLEDPYDETGNPNGVIQLGMDENKLTLDLVKERLVENAKEAILGAVAVKERS